MTDDLLAGTKFLWSQIFHAHTDARIADIDHFKCQHSIFRMLLSENAAKVYREKNFDIK